MKTFRQYILILIATITGLSCSDDFIDLTPIGTLTEENFYRNEEEIFQGLVSVYDVLTWGGTNNDWTMMVGLMNAASDDCYAGGSDASDQPAWVAYDNFNLDPFLGPQAGLWTKNYTGIARANVILEKIEEIPDIDPEFKARTIAEVRFLRAYFYFDQVRLFGNIILTKERIKSPEEAQQQVQTTPDEVYDFIEEDLQAVISSNALPTEVSGDESARVTHHAAEALLGKVILFQNDESRFGEAITLFENVINSGVYSLESDFGDIFDPTNEFNSEAIFEISYSSNQRGGWENFVNQTEGNYNVQFFGMRDYVGPLYGNGWSFCPVTEDLAQFMQNDPRFEHTIIDGQALLAQGASYTPGYQNTDYFIRKYAPINSLRAQDGEPALNWSNNEIVIRLADVYLMAAECMVRSGSNEIQARQYLNTIRSRVGLQPLSNSGQSLLDAIYRERRLELATEGHRFFDLVRTNRAADVLEGYVDGIHNYLPIPQREIDLTGEILTQNPGY